VTKPISERLESRETGDEQSVIWGGLSDHLPVIADFKSI
jgi:hypothetical protein